MYLPNVSCLCRADSQLYHRGLVGKESGLQRDDALISIDLFPSLFYFIYFLLIPFDYIPDHREQLKLPRLVINNHKLFIRVVEIPATKTTLVEGNQDFVFLEKTSDKVRYSTLKLQELNAKMKALQEENEQIQRALSEDLCNQVNKIQCSPNNSAELKQRERRRPGCHG